jgi:5-methylcytosine-specific restriction endonuclease McrA
MPKACICGRADCERHKRQAWRGGNSGAYGSAYQRAREIVLRQAGCEPGTGIGGKCAACGQPGTPTDPLQVDHVLSVADGGSEALENLRALHRSEHRRRSGKQGADGARQRRDPNDTR